MTTGRAEWAGHVEEWRSSGETATAFCEERGLKLRSLRYWSGRMRREAGQALNETVAAHQVRIARVRTKRERAGAEETVVAAVPIRVRVGEMAIEVVPGFDEETLARVLGVVTRAGGR